MSRSILSNFFQRTFIHPQHFTPYDPLECIEELNLLPNPDPIDLIKNHQSRHLEYDYENDPKTWIR